MHPFVFLFTWRRGVADGKCFRRRQTFLVELIQTDTDRPTHRWTSTASVHSHTFSYLHFFFFLVVFFFITLSVVCSMTYNVHERTLAPCAVTVPVHVLPSSSTVVMGVGGRGGGQINNVTGPVIEKGGNETEGSFHWVASCLWKLVDVSQVGVVEDHSDSIQGVRLSYSLQLYLRTEPHDAVRISQ